MDAWFACLPAWPDVGSAQNQDQTAPANELKEARDDSCGARQVRLHESAAQIINVMTKQSPGKAVDRTGWWKSEDRRRVTEQKDSPVVA